MKEGLSKRVAHHVASLFVREAMLIYDNAIELDDSIDCDHFENF